MRSTPTSRLSMFSPFGEMSPTQTQENPLDNAFYGGLRMPSTYAIRIHAEHRTQSELGDASRLAGERKPRRVLTVWECETKNFDSLKERAARVPEFLDRFHPAEFF